MRRAPQADWNQAPGSTRFNCRIHLVFAAYDTLLNPFIRHGISRIMQRRQLDACVLKLFKKARRQTYLAIADVWRSLPITARERYGDREVVKALLKND